MTKLSIPLIKLLDFANNSLNLKSLHRFLKIKMKKYIFGGLKERKKDMDIASVQHTRKLNVFGIFSL